MSEEQSGFKVTDRRLFNPDGTPRDIEREEEPATPSPAPAASQTAATSAAASPQTAQSAPAASQTETPPARPARDNAEASGVEQSSALPDDILESSAGRDDLSEEEEAFADEDIPGAHDPTSFVNFLMSIASNAAAALGMMEHPATGERGVDLQLAKHWIDVLGMLQQKTRGNLAPQEQQIFEGLLSDLRMQYVSLTGTPRPNTPRGFTGRDIIGGK